MGTAVITPEGAFEAGSYASFTLTYTAGFFGLDDTASLKVVFRTVSDSGQPQFDDPQGANYTTVEASNQAVLDYRYDPKGNIRPWDKTLYIKVVRGFLREGDQIVIRFGDPRAGSPGMRLQTFCAARFEFKVLVDAIATYTYVELPESPTIAIVPGPPAVWRAVLPTLCQADEAFRLCLKAEDRWGNPSDQIEETIRLRSSQPVDGLPESVTFQPGQFTAIIENLRPSAPGDLTIDLLDNTGNRLATSNPLRVVEAASVRHYWGDLHGQSGETVGSNSARDYFTFARDLSFLDVGGHQGNDFQITKAFWEELNQLTGEFNQPGRFVTLPGYEWSGNTALGGDRNVFVRSEGRPIRRSSHALIEDLSDANSDCHTAESLFAALAEEEAVVIAHVGGRYSDIKLAHAGRSERSVEVHSAWGTFEWLLHDAFEMGYRVGIVCNSDGHKGRPGASYPGASLFGAYGGLTCFVMPELTREAVFECLRQRHHYGTTGARIYVDVRATFDLPAQLYDEDPQLGRTQSYPVPEALMGDIVLNHDAEVDLRIEIVGTAPIERVEIRNGLDMLETVRPYQESDLGSRIRVLWEGAEYRGRGRQTLWDGTAQIIDNQVRAVRSINFFNPDAKLLQEDGNRLSWRALTTGNFGGFDAWLDDPQDGILTVETDLIQCEMPVADIGYEDTVFAAGGLGRQLRIFRLPDDNPQRQLTVERRITLRPDGDNPIYLCLTQEDGHRAWSSPIWIIRQA
jgi:hypothetical protein